MRDTSGRRRLFCGRLALLGAMALSVTAPAAHAQITVPDKNAPADTHSARTARKPARAADDAVMDLFKSTAKAGEQDEAVQSAEQSAWLTRPLQPSTFVVPGSSAYQTAHLLGQWGGLLPLLERNGIHPFVNYLMEAAGNPSGGKVQTGAYAHQVTLAADIDWFQIAHVAGLVTHIEVVNREGNNLSSAMGNLFDVQEIWGGGGDVARLVYFTMEQNLFAGRVNIMAGRMLAGTDFAASDLYCNFQNLGLCPNPESLFLNSRTSNGGFQIFPYSAWGGRIRVRPTRLVYVQGGAYEEQNSTLIGASGWDWSTHQSTGVLFPFEIGFTPGAGAHGLPGHYKIGGMFDTASHPDMLYQNEMLAGVNPIAVPKMHRGQTQIYALADQMVHRFGPGDTSGLVVLGGYVWSDAATAEITRFGFAGLSSIGMIPGRKMDQVSFLALYGEVNPRMKASDALERKAGNTAVAPQTNEIDFEADYAATVLPGTKLMPNVQYIVRPGAVSTYHNALVFGMRTSVLF
ncbi:carbohydrate porin [Tanticharoenia sakaeratensis]|nr:carbohydrate porin [Tanticharoenia sakaeratensis]